MNLKLQMVSFVSFQIQYLWYVFSLCKSLWKSVNVNLDPFTGECDPGFYCPGGQDTRDPSLFVCTTGHYCEVGSANPEPCPNGTYSNTTGNVELANCHSCTPGKYKTEFFGLC